jgi:hypothetical protein
MDAMVDEAGLLKAVTNVTSEPLIEQGQTFDSNEMAAVLEDFVSQLRPLVEQTDDQKVMEETVRTTCQLLDVSSREPWIDQASAVHIAPLEEDGSRLRSFEVALCQCNLKENICFAENAADSAFVAFWQQLISARCPGLQIDGYDSQHAKNAVKALRRTAHSHLARNNAEFFNREIQQNSRFTFRDGLFNAMSEDFVDIPPSILQEVYLGKLRQSCNDGDINRTAAGDWLVLQALCDAFKISIILVVQGPQGAPSYVHFKHVGVHQNAAFTCFLSYASGTFQSLSRMEGISMTVELETVTRTEICQTIESPIQTHLENVVAEEILDADPPLRVHITTLRGKDSLVLEMRACDTIGDVKAKIQAERDINCLEQRLIFADKRLRVRHAGAHLDDHRTLRDCDIQDECSLHLVFRLQGGGPSGDGGGSGGGRNSIPNSGRDGGSAGDGVAKAGSKRPRGQASTGSLAKVKKQDAGTVTDKSPKAHKVVGNEVGYLISYKHTSLKKCQADSICLERITLPVILFLAVGNSLNSFTPSHVDTHRHNLSTKQKNKFTTRRIAVSERSVCIDFFYSCT